MSWIIFLMRFNVNGQKSREAESDERDRLPPPPPRPSKAASRDRAMVPLVPPTEISSTTTPTSVPTSASGPVVSSDITTFVLELTSVLNLVPLR